MKTFKKKSAPVTKHKKMPAEMFKPGKFKSKSQLNTKIQPGDAEPSMMGTGKPKDKTMKRVGMQKKMAEFGMKHKHKNKQGFAKKV